MKKLRYTLLYSVLVIGMVFAAVEAATPAPATAECDCQVLAENADWICQLDIHFGQSCPYGSLVYCQGDQFQVECYFDQGHANFCHLMPGYCA